jgi:hypothetical protein
VRKARLEWEGGVLSLVPDLWKHRLQTEFCCSIQRTVFLRKTCLTDSIYWILLQKHTKVETGDTVRHTNKHYKNNVWTHWQPNKYSIWKKYELEFSKMWKNAQKKPGWRS